MSQRIIGRPPTWVNVLRRSKDFIDLRVGQPDRNHLPVQELEEAAASCFSGPYGIDANDPCRFLQYGGEDGWTIISEVRSFLNRFDRSRTTQTGELMMSAGNSHAIELITSTFTKPGDTVLVESPTYFLAHRIFEDNGLSIVEVDFSAKEELLQALNKHSPALAYCVPSYQNPGSTNICEARRSEIVELVRDNGVTLISDEAYQLLHFESASPPPPPVAELDRKYTEVGGKGNGTVLSCGSFSKIAAPGFRLGWIEGDLGSLEKLANRGYLISGGTVASPISCALMEQILTSGKLEDIVIRLRHLYEKRANALVDGLQNYCPSVKIANVDRIEGGYFVWCELPPSIGDIHQFLEYCMANENLCFLPGDACWYNNSSGELESTKMVRLCFAMYESERLVEATKRLGRALSSYTTPGQ